MARKFEIEEIKLVFTENNCTLLDNEYKNCDMPMKYICECGNESKISLKSFKNGSRCRLCGIKKVSEKNKFSFKFVSDYFDKNNCQLLSNTYEGNNKKLKYICPAGHITTTTFSNFQQGHRCKLCANEKHSNSITHSFDYVKNYIEVESKSGYKLLSNEYKGVYDKIEIMCNNNHRYNVTFAGFKYQSTRCKECQGLKNTFENIQNFVSNNSNHKLISKEYIRSHDKLEFLCDKSHDYQMRFNDFKRGSRCPECVGLKRLTLKEIRKRISNVNVDIEILNMKHKKNSIIYVECKCTNCKNIWEANWNNIYGGTGCPVCSESKGERRIRQFLEDNNILFLKEYTIDQCKNKRALFFDFAILNNNSTLNCLIEYDGIQHFQAVDFFGGNNSYKYIKNNDQIKNNFCNNNKIKLIRIPYWDFENIDKILLSELPSIFNAKELVVT